jgi:hypothetical protein
VTDLKRRWKWKALRPAARASVSSAGGVAAASIVRQARVTISACRSRGASSRGRQRRQARKPSRSAAAASAWKRTFSGRARREPQEGRQYTPVVRTE